MPLDRRELLAVSGTAGVATLAGCYALWDASRERLLDEGSGREIPSELDVLRIRSGSEHVVADDDVAYQLIRWEEGGRLTFEPGGSLRLEDINDA